MRCNLATGENENTNRYILEINVRLCVFSVLFLYFYSIRCSPCFGCLCTEHKPLAVFVSCREPTVCTAYVWRRCWSTTTVVWCQAQYPPFRTSTAPAHASAASSSLLSPPSMTSLQVLWWDNTKVQKHLRNRDVHEMGFDLCKKN